MQEQFDQASRFHQSGQFNEAESLYRQCLEKEPANPLLNARMGNLLHQTRRGREALSYYVRALGKAPNESNLLKTTADLALQLGEHQLAGQCLESLSDMHPEDLQLLEQLAGVRMAQGREQEALESVKKLIKLSPQNANVLNLRGMIYCRMGETEKGYKSFQKALKLNPGQLGVIKNLLVYGKGKKEPLLDQLVPQLEQQLRRASLPPESKMNIAYILFMYFEKRAPAKAFGYLKQGNDLNRTSYQYSHEQTKQTFEALLSAFDKDLCQAIAKQVGEQASQQDGPIFILGMPRSGTTLIEQILSSHSEVEAEGEIEDLRAEFEKASSQILNTSLPLEKRAEACLGVAQHYMARVRSRQSSACFTDKMPYNFMLIGLIASSMPGARIIHCTRDPLETCYSIYKQNFSGSHAYTNDLNELGLYYRLYQDMMAQWNQRFPGRIYEANYEAMVRNSDAEIESLLAFCGLEMQAQCMAFHKNKRTVRTASVAQVRQPIYKDAVKASSPFETELKELREVLEGKSL